MTEIAKTSNLFRSFADVTNLAQDRREEIVETLQNIMSVTDTGDDAPNT